MKYLPSYKTEGRPWGSFIRFTENEPSTVKIISVRGGEAFSLQTHEDRDEFWHILSGSGTVVVGENTQEVAPGDELFIPRTTPHRMSAREHGVVFLELAFGDFNENDISRIEDRYGRK